MSAQPPPLNPLSDPDNLDLIGERKDGGVDMLIMAVSAIDASDETCARLQEKLDTYLYAAVHPNFVNVYPAAGTGRIRIFVSDSHGVSDRARLLIKTFANEALIRNVEVLIGDPVSR